MSGLIGHNVHGYLSLSRRNFRIYMNVFTKTVHEQTTLWSWLPEHDHGQVRQKKPSQNPLQKETPFKVQFQVFLQCYFFLFCFFSSASILSLSSSAVGAPSFLPFAFLTFSLIAATSILVSAGAAKF